MKPQQQKQNPPIFFLDVLGGVTRERKTRPLTHILHINGHPQQSRIYSVAIS